MTQAEVPLPMVPPPPPDRRTEQRARAWWAPDSADAPARALPASGWYPDPPRLRYWNGEHWTEDVRFAGPPAPAARVLAFPDVRAPAANAAPAVADDVVAPAPAMQVVPAVEMPPPTWTAAPEPTAPAVTEPDVAAVEPERGRGALHEMMMLFLVAALALLAGAAVTAVGIALTV